MAEVIDVMTVPASDERARQVRCVGEALHLLYVDLPSQVIVDTRQAGQG